MGEAGALALYADELDMPAVRALLAAGPNHLGAAQPLPVANSDTLPPLLHTQVGLVPVWSTAVGVFRVPVRAAPFCVLGVQARLEYGI